MHSPAHTPGIHFFQGTRRCHSSAATARPATALKGRHPTANAYRIRLGVGLFRSASNTASTVHKNASNCA